MKIIKHIHIIYILLLTLVSGIARAQQTDPRLLMDERISELMAERIDINKEAALRELAALNERAEMEAMEDLLYPADDLYGAERTNQWVNPFQGKKVDYPDSAVIDCSTFVLPIDTMTRVTSKYGPRYRRMHRGIDLKVQIGDTIRAAFSGRIRIRNYERRGYGYYLVIRHPNGLETVYGHLSKFLVNLNDIVHAGDPIALGGNTGRSTGPHLHFETRFLGQAIDPAELIDFAGGGVPLQAEFTFRNVKINGRKSNIYTASNNQSIFHRVKSGETLNKIARMYGTTVSELCRLNGIKASSVLRVGQALRCTAGVDMTTASTSTSGSDTTKSRPTAATGSQAKKQPSSAAATAASAKSTGQAKAGPVYHKVRSGETLSSIARKYGTTVNKLCELNGMSKTSILKAGRSIRCS